MFPGTGWISVILCEYSTLGLSVVLDVFESAVGRLKHVVHDFETVTNIASDSWISNPHVTPQPTLAMRFSVPRSLSPSPVRKERYQATLPRSAPSFDLTHDLILLGHPARVVPSALHRSRQTQKAKTTTLLQTILTIPLNPRFSPCPCTHHCHNPIVTLAHSHCSSSSSRKDKNADETNYIADAIASIRLAISHHDPYEEWSNQTRREARVRLFGTPVKTEPHH